MPDFPTSSAVSTPSHPINGNVVALREAAAKVTTRAQWAAQIKAAHLESVEAIINIGRLLIEAKGGLEHGEFIAMTKTDLPFGARTAQRLMAIAKDERLNMRHTMSHLPPAWGTLYELSRLTDEAFEWAMGTGRINPDRIREDVLSIRWSIPTWPEEIPTASVSETLARLTTEDRAKVLDGLPRDNGRLTPDGLTKARERIDQIDEGAWRRSDIVSAIRTSAQEMDRIAQRVDEGLDTQREADLIRRHGEKWIALAEKIERRISQERQ